MTKGGWYRTFLEDPLGLLQVGDRGIRIRAVPARGERVRDKVEEAYAAKYRHQGLAEVCPRFSHRAPPRSHDGVCAQVDSRPCENLVVKLVPLVAVLLSLPISALTQSTAPMPLAYPVRGNSLRVDLPGFTSLSVQRGFRYAGGQRFILKGVADAEQHAFAEAGADGAIARFYWFQFESLLPAATGAYDYSKDTLVQLAGLDWRAQVRRYTTSPEPDGDQAALYKLFAARGWRPPLPALRARLVYVPAGDRRRELMIIYAEATAAATPPTAKESADLIARAQAGLRLIH